MKQTIEEYQTIKLCSSSRPFSKPDRCPLQIYSTSIQTNPTKKKQPIRCIKNAHNRLRIKTEKKQQKIFPPVSLCDSHSLFCLQIAVFTNREQEPFAKKVNEKTTSSNIQRNTRSQNYGQRWHRLGYHSLRSPAKFSPKASPRFCVYTPKFAKSYRACTTAARISRKGECLLNKLAQARRKEGSGNTLVGGRGEPTEELFLFFIIIIECNPLVRNQRRHTVTFLEWCLGHEW